MRRTSRFVKPLGSSTVQVEVSNCACESFCSCPVKSLQVEIRKCEVALKKRKFNEEDSTRMEEADMIVKRIDDELKAKKSKLIELCNEKTDLDEKISYEEELLDALNEEVSKRNKKIHQSLNLMKFRKEGAEEDYKESGEQVGNIESKIKDLKAELNKMEEAKLVMVRQQGLCQAWLKKVTTDRSKLEQSIEKQRVEDDEAVVKKKVKIVKLKTRLSEVLTGIENLPNDTLIPPSDGDTSFKCLREFIEKQIAAKEKELECPICMEVAASPILTCSEQHLICSLCRAKTEHCPVCSRSYHGKMKRHRYAEQALEEVDRLKRELDGLK